MISFEEAKRHGRGRHLRVRWTTKIRKHSAENGGPDTGTLTVTIGRIERSPDGMFRYFEPEANELNPALVDKNLNTLKKRIRAHIKR
jgi:hypothetical protein